MFCVLLGKSVLKHHDLRYYAPSRAATDPRKRALQFRTKVPFHKEPDTSLVVLKYNRIRLCSCSPTQIMLVSYTPGAYA